MRRTREARIDRDEVRAKARMLDGTGLRVWLDRAIDLLPDEAFPELVDGYVRVEDVLMDEHSEPDLLWSVRQFHRDSLAGRYYESFNVNSRNYMEKSPGTQAFIAEHRRLVAACLEAEESGDLESAAKGLELLIDLLHGIDECMDDIVFFADEAGSWQVGVRYQRVPVFGLDVRTHGVSGVDTVHSHGDNFVFQMHLHPVERQCPCP